MMMASVVGFDRLAHGRLDGLAMGEGLGECLINYDDKDTARERERE
jgi:hypothetical protein